MAFLMLLESFLNYSYTLCQFIYVGRSRSPRYLFLDKNFAEFNEYWKIEKQRKESFWAEFK